MPANTQAVRLIWSQQGPQQTRYRLYRNLFAPNDTGSFGLPLAVVDRSWFEDRLDLQPGTYHYTLVALDADGAETASAVTQTIDVIRVISIAEARQRGLLDTKETAELGQSLELAWHPLGTDYLGRDMLARLMYGGQVSLFIGIFAPLAFVLLGVIYGSISGFLGGCYRSGHDALCRLCGSPAVLAVYDSVQSYFRYRPGRKRYLANAGGHDYFALASPSALGSGPDFTNS
jgi:oligopeptide transport system permease protein